jgi:hypothetical protein
MKLGLIKERSARPTRGVNSTQTTVRVAAIALLSCLVIALVASRGIGSGNAIPAEQRIDTSAAAEAAYSKLHTPAGFRRLPTLRGALGGPVARFARRKSLLPTPDVVARLVAGLGLTYVPKSARCRQPPRFPRPRPVFAGCSGTQGTLGSVIFDVADYSIVLSRPRRVVGTTRSGPNHERGTLLEVGYIGPVRLPRR